MSLQDQTPIYSNFNVDAFFSEGTQDHEVPTHKQETQNEIQTEQQPRKKGRTKQRKKKASCIPCAQSGNTCNGNNPCSICISQNLQCKFPEYEVTEAPASGGRKRKQSDSTQAGGRHKKMKTTTTEGGELEDDHGSSTHKSSQDSVEDDDDTMDETPLAGVDSSAAPSNGRRPTRERKTSVKVLRALEDEQEGIETKKRKKKTVQSQINRSYA